MEKEDNKKSKIAEEEERILEFWQKNKIFEKSLEKDAPKGKFIFYEGPPTANARPALHHLEARVFKDIIPRYKTMQGFKVPRRAGWDTHGLPVELQIEKKLGLISKKDIEKYGVEEFNKACKQSVFEYIGEWERFTDRIGYWVDKKSAYYTFNPEFMETVWSIVKKVNERGLLYKDYKVVPWCPRCGTALSSHELAQGYTDVTDLSVTVEFTVKGRENTSILAWTTTPWTLPGNVGLAVGPNIDYVEISKKDEGVGSNVNFILAKDRLEVVFGNDNYKVEKEFKGSELIGLEYEPLYPYLLNLIEGEEKKKLSNAYKVYGADFVTTEDGTGVVHTAVMYGQEDFELGTKVGLPKFHLVSLEGTFIQGTDFLSGKFVRDEETTVSIIKDLAHRNLLFKKEKYKHTYPHCWRCKTALIYYARDSWYIKMSDLKKDLVNENKSINWFPEYIKEGRFGEWLKDIKDWAISRERYWGTPLPIWQNKEGKFLVIGSVDELKKKIKKSGNKYFTLRHGEAEQNLKDIINSDISNNIYHLTEDGKKRVLLVAENIKKEKIDLIITSPFLRCKETAEIVRVALGLDPSQVKEDERLVEFKKGSGFEGKKWQEYWDLFSNTKERFEKSPDGGENLNDLNKRAGEFIYDLESKYSGKNILIVSHQGPIASMHMISEGSDRLRFIEAKESGVYTFSFADFRKLDFVPLPHNENYELDLHKPYIDNLTIVDEELGYLERVSEVMDVWFDSGSMPFAQFGLKNIDNIEYPADFIAEAIDQTRGWFYTLHAIGVLMSKGKSYKNVVCLGHILDAGGKKMSKSVGNVVDPNLMMDRYGVDSLRFWMYTVNQSGDSKNFDEKTVDEIVKKVFNITSNIISFYELYKEDDVSPSSNSKNILDIWIVSLLSKLIEQGTKHLDNFEIFEAGRLVRDFVNDLSTWYLRRSRDRFKSDLKNESKEAKATLRFVLIEFSKYIAPFMPFFAENIYQRMKTSDMQESVHLCHWPKPDRIEEYVLDLMQEVRNIVSLALEKRMSANIKVRQPLNELKIKNIALKGKEEFLTLIKDEVNVKNISFDENLQDETELDVLITPELQREGNTREFIRSIQELRKNKNLMPSDTIDLLVETDDKGKIFLKEVEEEIKKPTNVREIVFEKNDGQELKIEEIVFKISLSHNS